MLFFSNEYHETNSKILWNILLHDVEDYICHQNSIQDCPFLGLKLIEKYRLDTQFQMDLEQMDMFKRLFVYTPTEEFVESLLQDETIYNSWESLHFMDNVYSHNHVAYKKALDKLTALLKKHPEVEKLDIRYYLKIHFEKKTNKPKPKIIENLLENSQFIGCMKTVIGEDSDIKGLEAWTEAEKLIKIEKKNHKNSRSVLC